MFEVLLLAAIVAAGQVITAYLFVGYLGARDERDVALRDGERRERAELAQRIQAPEVAVIQHQQDQASDVNGYPLTEEESARAQDETLRMIEEIERLEREQDQFAP